MFPFNIVQVIKVPPDIDQERWGMKFFLQTDMEIHEHIEYYNEDLDDELYDVEYIDLHDNFEAILDEDSWDCVLDYSKRFTIKLKINNKYKKAWGL